MWMCSRARPRRERSPPRRPSSLAEQLWRFLCVAASGGIGHLPVALRRSLEPVGRTICRMDVDPAPAYSTHEQGRRSDAHPVASEPSGRRGGAPDRQSNGDTVMRYLGYTLGDDSVPTPPPRAALMTEMGTFV